MQSARVGGPLEGVASSSRRENRLEGWGLFLGRCPPSLAPPSNLHFTARVSLRVSVQLSLCLSVSRARLPSPAAHPPFSWRQVRRFPFLRATPSRRQQRAFCTSCFNSCRAPFPLPDRPDRPGSASDGRAGELARLLPRPTLRLQGERGLDVGAELSALGLAPAPALHPR